MWNKSSTWKYALKREKFDSNVSWNRQPIWTCFDNIIRKIKKQILSACVHEHFATIMVFKKQRSFDESSKFFTQSPWNVLSMTFISIRGKRKTQTWLLFN